MTTDRSDRAKELRALLNDVEAARERVSRLQDQLSRLLKNTEDASIWTVHLNLSNELLPYGYRDIEFKIPRQLVEQQIIDKIKYAKRELIEAEGRLP